MSKRWTAKAAEFVWHGDHPDVEAKVRADLKEGLDDLRRAEDLVFHDAWLEGDPHGPCVLVWGIEGDKRLHCEYREKSEWVSLDSPGTPSQTGVQ